MLSVSVCYVAGLSWERRVRIENGIMQKFEHINSLLIADYQHIRTQGVSSISFPRMTEVLYYYPSQKLGKSHEQANLYVCVVHSHIITMLSS